VRIQILAAPGVLLVSLITAGATHLTPQASAKPVSQAVADTVGCLDTLQARDTISAVVTMGVTPQDRRVKLPPDFEGLFVQEFRSRLKIPKHLALSVVTGWPPCDSASHSCAGGALMLGSKARATAHPGGTLSRIIVVDFALLPDLTDSVRALLQKLSDEKLVPFFTTPDSIPLDIFIHVEPNPDTVPAFRHLVRAAVPHYSLQFKEADWPKDARGPRYPSVAERAGVEDSVDLTFTILSDGTVAPQSVAVNAGYYRDFIRAVFDRLATIHYVPARIGSCPVSVTARQRFLFKVPNWRTGLR
jgi:hypothetical protein